MIPYEKSWHYLAVTKLHVLLRGIISKNNDDFYCLNCLHSFRTENKLKYPEKVFKNKYLCGIVMSSQKDEKKLQTIVITQVDINIIQTRLIKN